MGGLSKVFVVILPFQKTELMRIVKAFWKPIVWAFVVLGLSAMSGENVEKLPLINVPNIDKVAHFIMYFVFTFLMMYDFTRFKGKVFSRMQIIVFSLLVTILYGGGMELLQSIPRLHRSTDIKDFLANSSGAICAVLLYKPIAKVFDRILSFILPQRYCSL